MDQNQNSSLFSMNLDAQNSYTLRSTASWAKVLGVASLITAGLCLLFGLIVQQALSREYSSVYSYRRSGISSSGLGAMGLAVYVIMALLYAVSGIFALTAGNKITAGLKSNNMETLNAGFAGARNFFALWAILLIIFLVLMFISLMSML